MSKMIQVDYEQLDSISRRFAQQAETVGQALGQVRQVVDGLASRGWEGEAARVFQWEVEDEVLPAVSRLGDALAESSRACSQIAELYRRAEEEARGILNGKNVMAAGVLAAGGLAFGPPTGRNKARPAKTAKRKVSAQQQKAEALSGELRAIFAENFKGYAPKGHFKPVPITVVSDKDWAKAIAKHNQRLEKYYEKQYLKLAPDRALEIIRRYREGLGEEVPYDTIDENTRLQARDRAQLLLHVRRDLAAINPKNTAGIFDTVEKKIYVKESEVSAGTIAHELGHAYNARRWDDVRFILDEERRMQKVGDLEEGMAGRLADDVLRSYDMKNHSLSTGFGNTQDMDLANEFVDKVGEKAAYEAFFGGFIDYTDDENPEDTLRIGKKRVKYKWPWR